MHVVLSSTLCMSDPCATLERRDCHKDCTIGKRWSTWSISKARDPRIWACASVAALKGHRAHSGCHARSSSPSTYTVHYCPHFVLSINEAQTVSTQPPKCPRKSQQSRSHAILTLRMIAAHCLRVLLCSRHVPLWTQCARKLLPSNSVHPNQPFAAESVQNASAHSHTRIWSFSQKTLRISANATKREYPRTIFRAHVVVTHSGVKLLVRGRLGADLWIGEEYICTSSTYCVQQYNLVRHNVTA